MKGSIMTGRTWVLLSAAALLISAGLVNFWQRAHNHPPPWDGATWIDTAQGVVAKTVKSGSSAARASIIPGDHLIAISQNGQRCEDVTRGPRRSEEHTSELQSHSDLVCRLLLEKKKRNKK